MYTYPYIFELRELSSINLTINSERIIELEHNRSVQSTKTWYSSIGTHFEILTLKTIKANNRQLSQLLFTHDIASNIELVSRTDSIVRHDEADMYLISYMLKACCGGRCTD